MNNISFQIKFLDENLECLRIQKKKKVVNNRSYNSSLK